MSDRYFDIHAHLDFPDYNLDRSEVIARTVEEGVLINTVGTNPPGNKKAVSLANQHAHIYATVGFHPNDLDQASPADWQELERLISSEAKVVGVGECGLDYFRLKESDLLKIKDQQHQALIRQFDLAHRYNKSVMVHTRPTKGTMDAYEDTARLLEKEIRPKHPNLKINLHCFSADWPMAKQFLGLGCSLSFTGVITFARDYDEVIKNVPLESLMAETDSPFLSPEPFRGQRNEPIRVALVVETLAKIRGVEADNLAQTLLDNSRFYFDL